MRPSTIHYLPVFKRSSYYDSDYRQSAALIRARRPYLFKNMATGLAITTFAVAVFAFTIKAVGQDKFEDVIVPDAPVSPPTTQQLQQTENKKSFSNSTPPKVPNVAVNGAQS